MFLSAVSPGSPSRSRLGGLGGKLVKNLRTTQRGRYIVSMFLRVLVPAHPGCPG